MSDVIYLVQSDGKLVEMTATPYDSEPRLQKLLADYPHLLAGSQMNEENPRRWLLIAQEMGIPWEEGGGDQLSLDHLFLDQDGIPTLVEVKRSTDTRIRREVVGQMLEYAANAVSYWPVEKLQARFEAHCHEQGIDARLRLAELLSVEADGELDYDQFWQQVHANLQAGRIRMLFVADEIPFQLRRIVEFLNEQMQNAEVLAIEVKQYMGSGLQTLVPRVVGQTARKEPPNSSPSKRWDEARFFEDLARRTSEAEVTVARRIFDWAQARATEMWWGQGKQDGSFLPLFIHADIRHQLISVWSNGFVELRFQILKSRNSLDDGQRLELLKQINKVLGTYFPDTDKDRRPNVKLSVFTKDGVLEAFLAELDRALQQIKANSI